MQEQFRVAEEELNKLGKRSEVEELKEEVNVSKTLQINNRSSYE